jgi:hypothetical protein
MRFLKKVRIREQMAWQFRQLIVDEPLFWFYCRNHKSDSKEKANSPASYTFCMAKKDLFYWRFGWRRSDKRCSVAVINNNRVFVIKSFKMPNFTNGL